MRRGHTIGLCFGAADVGKTVSARRYAHWDKAHDLLTDWGPRADSDAKIYAALAKSRTVLYTPDVLTTPRLLPDDLDQAVARTSICIAQHLEVPGNIPLDRWGSRRSKNFVQLIIVDESERLSATALELLRDRYHRDSIALILIGMPGLEKQFSHYPQFYSRVGFAHQYRPWATTRCSSSCNGTGGPSARHSTQTTSPTPKRSQRSRASPAGTSVSSSDSFPRSNAS